jgi:hypothetical protein
VHNGSWKTIYHYFAFWSKLHVFEHAFHDLVQFYRQALRDLPANSSPQLTTSLELDHASVAWPPKPASG